MYVHLIYLRTRYLVMFYRVFSYPASFVMLVQQYTAVIFVSQGTNIPGTAVVCACVCFDIKLFFLLVDIPDTQQCP